ncbi:MAG: hypothetical protein JXA74_11290, partial [Anaerolineae bacterium]|nr:hypothetical protein [Anaerolineae bacterium]
MGLLLLVVLPQHAKASEPLAASTWTLETPAPDEWSSLPVTVSVTVVDQDGLYDFTTAYRYTIDAGLSWTDWIADETLVDSTAISTTIRMTATLDALIDSATQNWVQFHVGDYNFDWELSPVYTITVDTSAPDAPLDLTADPASWTTTDSFTLNWSNPADLAGIVRAYAKLDAPPANREDYSVSAEGADIHTLSGVSVGTPGQHSAYVWLEDAAGNVDQANRSTVSLYYNGTIAPAAPVGLQIAPAAWTSVNGFDATWTNPPTNTGVEAAWYRWDTIPAHAEDGTRVAGADITSLTGLTVSAEGDHILYVWLEDALGLKDHNHRGSAHAYYDTTPPTTEAQFSPALPPSGWYNQSVTVDLVATDIHAQVKETRWRREGGLWNSGISFVATDDRDYEFYSVDNANNIEATRLISVPIDMLPPTSFYSVTPPEPAGGWYSETVTVAITATDDLSGWGGETRYRVDGGPWRSDTVASISTEGIHRIEFYSRDVAGNEELPHQIINPICRIDLSPPEVEATPDKEGEYIKPPVTIALTATDSLTGIDRIEYRRLGDALWTVGDAIHIDGTGGEGEYTFEYRARDLVGNISLPESISLTIDDTPPRQPTNLVADPGLWSNQNGVFGLTWLNPVPPDLSGVAGVYYQIDVDPTVTLEPTYVAGEGIQVLSNLSVPDEGEHTIYIWLQDRAGNSDPFANRSLPDAFQYDITSPSTSHTVDGVEGDDPQYYRGPVEISLTGEDGLSGVSQYHYREDQGAWVTRTVSVGDPYVFVYSQELRHTIYYRSTDLAGNLELPPLGNLTVRIDSTAPSSPSHMISTPADWTNVNNFEICWQAEDNYSGIGTVYYKFDQAPASGSDYEDFVILTSGQSCISGLTLEQDGQVPVYVWLKDRAGNVDHTAARSVSLKLDRIAPDTAPDPSGTLGENGYYVSPVSLCFDAFDGSPGLVSGVAHTYYRVNGGELQIWNGVDLQLSEEGEYEIEFWSRDVAGNEERPHKREIYKIDLYAPSAQLWLPSQYAKSSSVDVRWGGTDSGSSIASYSLQYRMTGCGPWQVWQASTASTQGIFSAPNTNVFYYFRAQAKDLAGRLSTWSDIGSNSFVYVEGLGNADFDLGDLGAWVDRGELSVDVIYRQGWDGLWSHMARLGEERPCEDELTANDYASVYQVIQPPSLACDPPLRLIYRYRIQTYDVAWGKVDDQGTLGWIDPFEVYIRDVNGNE